MPNFQEKLVNLSDLAVGLKHGVVSDTTFFLYTVVVIPAVS